MTDTRIATLDSGQVNERIMAKEAKTDFRRVEAASVKRVTNLTSAEGKRMFLRCFGTFQLNVHFISSLARMKLPHDQVEAVEDIVRKRIEEANNKFNKHIDAAEGLFQMNGINTVATYETVPMTVEVGVISSLGRRYFEAIHRMDQVMPILQTLEVEELRSMRDVDALRADCKKAVIRVARSARELANGLRRRINQLTVEAQQGAPEGVQDPAPAGDQLQTGPASEPPKDSVTVDTASVGESAVPVV